MDRLLGPHKYGWFVFVIVVALAASSATILAYRFFIGGQRIDKAQTALTALCAQRHDLDLRIAAERGLLTVNPHEKFIFAIPRSLIVQSLNRDMTTRRNLDILDCRE